MFLSVNSTFSWKNKNTGRYIYQLLSVSYGKIQATGSRRSEHSSDARRPCPRAVLNLILRGAQASLMRWNRQYNGKKESLVPKSHKPHSPHPNIHTEQELKWIRDYHRRNPNISVCELYGKLREEKAYSRHLGSLYRVFVRLGFRKKVQSTKKETQHTGQYDTPKTLGEKWQMDVKYVPTNCYTGKNGQRYYQCTVIEEASRKRFIYAYEEQSSYSTVDFIQRAILYFGYAPNLLQTDNGAEFTHLCKTRRRHPLDVFCDRYGITHKLIRPRTPWHNGKVERSHRNDQERFILTTICKSR